MKNLINKFGFIAILLLAATSMVSAQPTFTKFTQYANGTGVNYVVNTNSATTYLYAPYMSTSNYEGLFKAQAWVTNASGTTGGYIFLQGSLDSLHWDNIYSLNGTLYNPNVSSGSQGNGVDSFNVSSTNLCKGWYGDPVAYPYVRLKYIGTGTHSDTLWGIYKVYMKR